ncbi:helix-turn-helix domain-containing protein [Streptomyces argenteolus]
MGVSVETVRFHSDGRLLPEVSHSACGHRRYAPEAAERLSLIRSLRGLDPPVPEVRRILDEGCWRRGRHAGGRRRRPAAPADCAWSGRSPLHPSQLAGRSRPGPGPAVGPRADVGCVSIPHGRSGLMLVRVSDPRPRGW